MTGILKIAPTPEDKRSASVIDITQRHNQRAFHITLGSWLYLGIPVPADSGFASTAAPTLSIQVDHDPRGAPPILVGCASGQPCGGAPPTLLTYDSFSWPVVNYGTGLLSQILL